MSRTQKLKELVAASLILKTLNDNPYIVAQLQKPQNRHYSALGPLYLKIKVSKMSFSLSITDIGRGELTEIQGDRQFAGSDFTRERGHFIFSIRHSHGQRNDVVA